MSHERSIAKNMFAMSAGHIAGRVLMFVFTVILARELGDESFGTFSFAFAYVAFGFIVADLGISVYSVREIAKDPSREREFLENGMPLKLVLSAIAGILMLGVLFALAPFLDDSRELLRIIPWLAVYVLGDSFIRLFVAIFRARHNMEVEAVINVFIRVIITSFGILILYSDRFADPLLVIILVYTVAHLLAVLFLFEKIRSLFPRIRFRWLFSSWKTILTHSWPFALSIFFTGIYYNLDTLMIGFMRNFEEVGWYNAAYRIIFFLLMFIATFQSVLLPVFSKLAQSSKEELRRMMSLASRVLFMATIPLAVGGLFVARDLLNLVYTEEYVNGAIALSILLFTVVVNGASSVYATAMQAMGHQKIQLHATAAGAILNAVLNAAVIPVFSLNGAAVTTLISELAVLFYLMVKLRPLLQYSLSPHLARPVLAGCCMGLGLWLFHPPHVLVAIALGAGIYGIALIVVGGVRLEELRKLTGMLKRG
ncbi:MAG: flippase [Candidatus Kerfeldbacteria bacterium]|nr:flippase [Candidatus Kerfeldbacteria bacterium]